MKWNSWQSVLVIVLCGLVSLGTIRRKDDPILRTQTDPILAKQKIEEEKDGKKGAPMPSITNYAETDFQTDPPVDEAENEEIWVPTEEILSQEESSDSEDALSEDWWYEETPEASENPFKDYLQMDENTS